MPRNTETISQEADYTEMGTKVVQLSLGSKRVTLEVHLGYGTAASYVEKTDRPRIPGETTKLYRAVREQLEMAAAESPTGSVYYTFQTGFPSMVAWAKDRGNELFHWDSLYASIDDPMQIRATAIIHAKPDQRIRS